MPAILSLSLPDTYSPLALADWLEVFALCAHDGSASHGDLSQALKILKPDELSELCSQVMQEISLRVTAAGDAYPFEFTGTLVRLKGNWKNFSPYVFCLLLSYCKEETKNVNGINHSSLFEHLSCIAAKQYIGGEAIRFGAPRDTLPRSFLKALEHVIEELKEWELAKRDKTYWRKDGGLDLVAWKHFPDKQIGKLVLFGHCASGQNWEGKISELIPEDFCSLWLGGIKSPVVKSFFVPHRLEQENFSMYAISAKLFFDRCRIAYCITGKTAPKSIPEDINVWCKEVLSRVVA